jgi:hypothetical protein
VIPRTSAHALLGSFPRYGIRKHAKAKSGQAHSQFPLKALKAATNHTICDSVRFSTLVANHNLQISATTPLVSVLPIRPSLLRRRCAALMPCPASMGSSHRSPPASSDLPPLFPPHLSNLVVDENLPSKGSHTQSCSSIPSTIPSASSAPFSNCTIIILL